MRKFINDIKEVLKDIENGVKFAAVESVGLTYCYGLEVCDFVARVIERIKYLKKCKLAVVRPVKRWE